MNPLPYADPEKRREYNREYQRNWARENRDKRLVYERSWNERNREKKKEYARKTREINPEKRRAQIIVSTELRAGRLVPLPCADCGECVTQAHHEDYSQPLKIIWLCRTHHLARHRRHP